MLLCTLYPPGRLYTLGEKGKHLSHFVCDQYEEYRITLSFNVWSFHNTLRSSLLWKKFLKVLFFKDYATELGRIN
jgi:hypothetical protein